MDPIDVTDIQPKPFLNNFTSQSQHKMKSKFKHRITDRFLPNPLGAKSYCISIVSAASNYFGNQLFLSNIFIRRKL